MEYKLYSNITCSNPAEGATENIEEGLHYQEEICSMYKLSHTLKTNVFELPDNKNFGKLFSKYELLLDQANFSPNPFQVLILQYLIPTDSLPPLTSL